MAPERNRVAAEEYMAGLFQAGQPFEVCVSHDPAGAIRDLLLSKGLNPRDVLLAEGEYERLVAIVGANYPEAIAAWVDLEVRGIQRLRKDGASDKFIKQAGLNTYYKELRVLFERFPEMFGYVEDIIEFV